MQKYDFEKMSSQEIEKAILQLRAETEVLKKETEAIKKQGEEEHKRNLIEIDMLRKEREAVEKKLQSTMDRLGFNIGMSAEELFANSIEKTMEIDGIKYYKILKNYIVANNKGDHLSEIDIVLFNKKYICFIEVKHNAKLEDLTKLTENTVPNFIKIETKYNKFIVLPFLAGLSFQKNVIEQAKQKHIGLLKYRGEHFKVINNI